MINFTKPTAAPSINYTDKQQGALDSTAPVLLINSTAGSGKTQLLQQFAFDNPNAKVLYLAFNKQIVEDVQSHLPDNCEASTFHAFGLKIIRNNQPQIRVDFYKYSKLTSMDVSNLVQKHYALGGANARYKWEETCNRFFLPKRLIPEAMEVMKQANEMTTVVSGSDMISLPIRMGYKSPSYDIVLCDEIQDCGIDKIQLISTIKADRLIMVGDTVHQKINSFSGSDPEILELLTKTFNPEIHTINETFRCPKQIIKEARKYNPKFFGSKKGGEVSWEDVYEADFPSESLIMCRANAPLLKAASVLINQGKSFSIKKTIIDQVSKILKRLSKYNSNINTLRSECRAEMEREIDRFRKNKWNPAVPEYKYEAVLAALNVGTSLGETESFLKNLTDNTLSKSKRILSTIHSSKGMQSPNVFYLEPKIGKYIALKSGSKQVAAEEKNVAFVATTRSQENLTYLSID